MNEKRRNGYDSHRDDQGRRYGTRPAVCVYCGNPFNNRRQGAVVKCCDACMPLHEAELHERKVTAKKTVPYRAVENRGRRLRVAKRMGLDAEWVRVHGNTCAICGSTLSATGRGLGFDHDHGCCALGCPECFRGVLCHNCNFGLGYFKDDPNRLRAAADYIEKFQAKNRAS